MCVVYVCGTLITRANLDLLKICLVNSCQEKDAGVVFRLNYSIHQHTGTGCDTSSYMLFNLAKENSVSCMCAAASRLDNIAYTESLTDAYNQYFVKNLKK